MVKSFAKQGDLLSKVFLEYVRSLDCAFCSRRAPSFAHHYPPKGRGITRDDFTIPVCVECHKRCHGETVRNKLPIPKAEQQAAAIHVRSQFLDDATPEQVRAFANALERRAGKRVW